VVEAAEDGGAVGEMTATGGVLVKLVPALEFVTAAADGGAGNPIP
jgi:hypothetical protein